MLYAVIMAGGSGTRFWPASRRTRPKQLLRIDGANTMIRATVERIAPVIPIERTMVVTGASHAAKIRLQLPEIEPTMFVEEPKGLNTAPCVALAACKLAKSDPDSVMAVLPADHLIEKQDDFRKALIDAAEVAAQGASLITFGIVPDRPETGYGYIKLGPAAQQVGSRTVYKVDRFVEKPDKPTAEQYVASGQFLWNSGMFIWRVDAIMRAFEAHLPQVCTALEHAYHALNTPDEPAAIACLYDELDPISIDYGIMEKASNVLTIPIDVGWNDVGSWDSLEGVWGKDDRGNVTRGDVFFIDGMNCVVSSPLKLTALIGVEDLIVVDTPDALMICRKDRAQDVRKLHEQLEKNGWSHLL
ncbi:MAG: mannose-1-phosphate guanylyltransferase [Thermodesulfobacteriota bacterium]